MWWELCLIKFLHISTITITIHITEPNGNNDHDVFFLVKMFDFDLKILTLRFNKSAIFDWKYFNGKRHAAPFCSFKS